MHAPPHAIRQRPAPLCSLFLCAALLASGPAFAQSARASFFLQMLQTNADPRVRLSAALRLGELHDASTVQPLVTMFPSERDPNVQAAILAALAALGDGRGLAVAQGAVHNPSSVVSGQARRTVTALQAAASGGGAGGGAPPSGGASSPPAGGSGGPPRFLVGVGRVNNQSTQQAPALAQAGEAALRNALGRRHEVVVHTGAVSAAQSAMRAQSLHGHFFDANIQQVQASANSVRVAVSILVSTYPGRVYEFESSSTITIVSSSASNPDTQADAVRRAIESATDRAVTQLP